MLHLRDISEDTVLFPWKNSMPVPAVQSTIAVCIALVLGEITGHRGAASIAAGAAFTVGFAVFHEALSSTLLSMAMLTAGIASATLAGSLGAQWTPLVLVLCVVAALNYGLLASVDATASWIGQQCGIFVIISSYFSNGVHYAVGRTSMVILGSALQMVLYAAARLLQRRRNPVPANTPPLLQQTRTRLAEIARELRRGAFLKDDAAGYVLRLAITLALTTAIYRFLHLRNGYWAPMTALLVLKPKWGNTLSRGVARLSGTLLGAGICTLLAHLPVFHHWTYFILIALTAWGCFALQAVNYALFSMVLTMYTVFLFAFGGFSERAAADLRLINTAVGGLLALLVDFSAQRLGPRLRSSLARQTQVPATQS